MEKYEKEKLTMGNEALIAVKSTFGRFNVFFSELSMTVIEERPVYNLVSVVSNFGGLLGLYLGFSVLTILELVDFAFDMIEYFNLKGKTVRLHKVVYETKHKKQLSI